MKAILLTAAAISVLAAPAFASETEVEVKNAVARVVVIVEDRADVAVEVEQGASRLPRVTVERRSGRLIVDGGVRGGVFGRNGINNCRSGPANATQPGQGASVDVRGLGRVNLDDAPLIVIRSPRAVDVKSEGAVFGSVGRGASSLDLTSGGCGDWTIANVNGAADVTLGGSGDVRMGTSRSLDVTMGGAGTLVSGTTGGFDLTMGGSGNATVSEVNGAVDITIGGSGEVTIRQGQAQTFDVTIGGSGDIDFGGVAGDVDVTIAGSGDVRVARATGSVRRQIMGSGDIRIGQ